MKLGSGDNVGATGSAAGDLGEGDEGVVLATVEAASLGRASIATTSAQWGVVLSILLPGDTSRFQKVNDAAGLKAMA